MSEADVQFREVVARALPRADAATVDIVTACAGLLASVAYADRSFSPEEAERARQLLATVDGIGSRGSVVEESEAEWERVMRVNVTSMMLASKHAVPAIAAAWYPAGRYPAGCPCVTAAVREPR